MKKKIAKRANSLQGDLVTFLRDIIAIPSFSGKEEAVVKRIKEEMKKLGYSQIRVDPLGNIMGTIGSGKRIIAVDGHCDTVGVGNPENWEFDPFTPHMNTNPLIEGSCLISLLRVCLNPLIISRYVLTTSALHTT